MAHNSLSSVTRIINQSKKKTVRKNFDNSAYVMIAPFYLLFLFFVLIPIFVGLYFSFTNYDLYKSNDFVGLKNYRYLFIDDYFIASVKNTLIYTVLTIFPTLSLGLLFAVFFNRKIFGIKFFRVSFFIPHVTSMVSASMIWLWIYEPTTGILNRLLESIGLKSHQWLANPDEALYCIILMSIWKFTGYNMTIFLSGLQGIPDNLYEASTIDGANSVQKFFKITLPMLRPTTFFLFVNSCIRMFNVFEQVNILTGGGPLSSTTTIVHQIYTRAFREYDMGYASAMAMILLLIVSFITMINFRYGSKGTSDLEIG
jgi:ABC-type sugar transport system permease subunit